MFECRSWIAYVTCQNFGHEKCCFADVTKDGSFHTHMKHINICYHFIRFIVDSVSFLLVYCPTADMTVDTLTKALPSVKAKHFTTTFGLRTTSGGVLTR